MAINGGNIQFGVSYKVDESGLQNIKTQLNELSRMKPIELFNQGSSHFSAILEADDKLDELKKTVQSVEEAYDNAFDSTTGVLNINKLSQSLKNMDGGMDKIAADFQALGPKGTAALNAIISQTTKANIKFRETNNMLTKMGETLSNTIKWGISSSLMNKFTSSVQQAWGYVQHLDTSLNDIRIVTGKSADEMDKFAEKANNAAKALGSSTTEYTEAALIYYQQGLSDEESQARAETTLKAANVTGQSGQAVSEQLTAVWNGYKVTAEETELYVDKLAAVAASTAADLEELSTGMSKVASAANNMGVDIDQLNAQLATIVSVTRQAPETAGTALKTIYARMEDLKIGGEDESGIKLGEVSSTLEAVGISVLDTSGDLRDLGKVIEEVAGKWETWTSAQQSAIAQALAGKRQYNNLLALFDNWDMYTDALETSKNATGTLQKQQDIYMESTEAHLQKLKTEWEDVYDSLLDTKTINTALTGITAIVDKLGLFIDSIGGGAGVLTGLLSAFTGISGISNVLSKNLGEVFSKSLNAKMNAQEWAAWQQNITNSYTENNAQSRSQLELLKQILPYENLLDDNAKKQVIEYTNQISKLEGVKEVQGQILAETEATVKAAAELAVKDSEITEETKQAAQNVLNASSSHFNAGTIREDAQSVVNEIKETFNNNLNFQALGEEGTYIDQLISKMEDAVVAKQNWDTAYKNFSGNETGDTLTDFQLANENLVGIQETINQLKSSLDKPLNFVSPTAKAEVEKLKEKLSQLDKLVDKSPEEIKKAFAEIEKAARKMGIAVKSGVEETENNLNNLPTKLEATSAALKQAKADFDEFLNTTVAQNYADGFIKITNSVSSMAFAFQSFKNIGNIWENQDSSIGEKILSTVITLSTSIPMLVNGLKNLAVGIDKVRAGRAALVELNGKYNQITTLTNAIDIASLSAEEKKAAAKELLHILSKQQQTDLLKEAGLEQIDTNKIDENTAALILNTNAKMSNNGASLTMGTLLKGKVSEGLGVVATALGISTGAVVALGVAIGVVIGVLYLYSKHLKEVREAEAAAAEARAEAAKEYTQSLEDEKTKVDELISSYQTLKDQYEDHSISLKELREKTYDLAIEYGNASLAIQALTSSYEDLESVINKLNFDKNEELIEAAETEKGSLENKIRASIWRDMGESERDTYALDDEGYGHFGGQFIDLKGFDVRNDDEQKLAEGLKELGITIYDDGKIDYNGFIDALINNREELQNILNNSSSKAAAQLQGYINGVSEDLARDSELDDIISTGNKDNRNIKLVEADIKSQEEAKKAYEQYMKTATEVDGLTWEEAQKQFTQYANTMDNVFVKQEAERQTLKSHIEEDYLAAANEQGIDTSDWDVHQQVDDTIEYLLNQGYSYEDIELISKEQWKDFIVKGLEDDTTREEIKQEIDDKIVQNLEDVKANFLNNDIGQFNIDLNTVISSNVSGDLTADDETYQKLASQLDSIKEAFPDLTDEANTFLNEGLIGTEKWTQAAYKLQEAFDKQELDRLVETYENELKDLTPELDDAQFKQELDEILDADYAITVKVHSDGIEDFENAEEALDNIDDMASKIGDDFIVAADDIRELNNTFPGILDGMTYLADGTVQLNEEMVKSAMSMATEEELASTDVTATKLENTAAELRAKADVYDSMAELAYQLADDESNAEEKKTIFVTQLQQKEIDDDEKGTNIEIDNSNLVADTSASDAQTLANNWVQAYEKAATASNEWADVALAAQNAVENGKESLKKTAFNVDYTGNYSGSTAQNKASSTKLEATPANEIDWEEVGNQYSQAAETNRFNANDLEGAAAELRAKALSSANTNADAADGITKTDDSSSGSSSSEDEAETEEYLEREEDLYKQINEQLEDVESTLSRIQTIDEHSWGINSKKVLEEENELLKTQMELYEQKSETQKSELADKRAELEAQGIAFSEDGSVMTNTEETLDELYEEYNAMVDVYNAMTASEQETYKETLEAKQDTIDEIEEAIDDYESAYSDYNDTLDELLDTHYAIIENEVKQFTAEVEVHLELAEARNEWVDFWYDVVEDVEDTDFGKLIAKSMEKLDTYIGQEGTVLALTNEADIAVDEVKKQIANAASAGGDSIFGDDSALSKETLETIRGNLIDAVTSAKEEIDNIKESILDAYDDMGDKIEEQAEGWKTIGDQLEHNLEVIKLIDGESAYGELNNQYEQIKQNDLELADWWSKQVTRYSADIQKYQDLLNATASTDPMYRVYSDLLDKATEKYKDAVSNVNETVESSIKHLQDLRDNTINQALDKLDKSLSNNMGLDSMKDQWDLAIERQDYFLDNVERSLAMDEIEDEFKTIFEGIDTTSSKYQDLLKFQDEEIAKLNQKNKLTQYDIDELKARLEIKKQELALEEAQQNKSNLRLRRDSQGNYTYQYTADEDAVDEAEKNLLTARRDWYELVKQRNEDVTEEVYDIRKRLAEKTDELNQALVDKDEARAEYLRQEIKELTDYEIELTQEGQKARQDFYKGTADFFADVDNNSILPMWDTTMSKMIDDWNDGTEASFVGAVQTGINEIDAAHAQYVQDVETLMTAAGRTMEDYRNNGIDPTTESLQELQESNDEVNESLDETETLIEELTTELDKAMDAYESLEDTAVKSIEEINKTLKTLSETTIETKKNMNDLEEASKNAATAVTEANNAKSTSNGSTSGSSSSTGTEGNSSSTTTTKTPKKSASLIDDPYGVANTYGLRDNSTGQYVVIIDAKSETEAHEKLWFTYKDRYTGFKSGGYTGSWNNGSDENNGRLAFLHQKELVLNESDTSNILNAVNSVRDLVKNSNMNFGGIANSIASINAGQIQALSQISANGLRNIASMVSNETNNQGVSNTVINADFSGVRSADAIYQALIELENYGAQQAYSSAPSANNRY